jgi:drug/metabolite transporter (DMT)-like permease
MREVACQAARAEGARVTISHQNDRRVPPLWTVALALACVYVIWGTTYYALKVGLRGAGPYYLIGTRFIVAGLPLMAFLRWRGHALPTFRQWRGASVIAFLLLVVSMGNVTVSEQWVSSGATVALISLAPVITALWSVAFGSRPKALEWVAMVLGACGTLVMIMGQDLRASPLGTTLIIVGISAWSLGSVLSRHIVTPPGAMGFAAEMLIGGVMALGVSVLLREPWVIPHAPVVWWAWAYLVVFGSLIAFSAYRYLVDHVSPTLATSYAYVNPPVALFVGWWLGAESFSMNVLIGLPVVLGSVGLLAWAQLRTPAPAAPAEARATPAAPVAPVATSQASTSPAPRFEPSGVVE